MADNLPAVITDEDSGDQVAITDELRLTAREVHEEILLQDRQTAKHMVALGAALKRLRDERLYLALGFRSFSAYCEGFQMSRQVAYDRIAASEVIPQLMAPEVVAPVRQVSYTNALLMSKANPEDRQTVAAEHDVSTMSKRQVEKALAEAKVARLEADEAKREAAAQKQRADASQKEATDLGRRLEKAVRQAEEARNKPPDVIEKPVHDPDDARKIAALEREVAHLKNQIQRPAQTEQRLQLLEERLAAVKGEIDRVTALREQALTVNQAISALIDVGTRQRGVLEIAVGKQLSGDWFDAGEAQNCIGLMEAICKDIRRLIKDSTPSTIDI